MKHSVYLVVKHVARIALVLVAIVTTSLLVAFAVHGGDFISVQERFMTACWCNNSGLHLLIGVAAIYTMIFGLIDSIRIQTPGPAAEEKPQQLLTDGGDGAG